MSHIIKGIHHISIKCKGKREYAKTVDFYTDVLGLQVKRAWKMGDDLACMLDLGNGLLEISSNAEVQLGQGVLRHLALWVEDVDMVAEKVVKAGYQITMGPEDGEVESEPKYSVRFAFFDGPQGEEIELLQEK